MIDIYFKCNENAKHPVKAHETDAGFDLYSTEEIMLYPGKQEKFDTGVAVKGRFVDPEDAKKFIIPKHPDDENQYRVLSFPWCIAGLLLSIIKFLN